MANRLGVALLRSFLLFVLSVVLVAGFYFHSEFYAIGLYPLLLLGGFVTFLVITAAKLIVTGEVPRGRPTAEVALPIEEGERLARGAADLVVLPSGAEAPHVGQVVHVRYETGADVGRFIVLDSLRTFLEDVTDEHARHAGHIDAASLREAGARTARWRPGDVVGLVRLRPQGARR